MNTFKLSAPAGDLPYGTTNDMYARPTTIEADLAAYGGGDFGPSSGDMWDGAVAIMIRLDDDTDDMELLKDELDLFRRENAFDFD